MNPKLNLEGLRERMRGLHPLLKPASILWALVFVVVAIALAQVRAGGLLAIDDDSFALIEAIALAGLTLSVAREYLLRPLDALANSEDLKTSVLGRAIPVMRDILLLVALVATTTLTLELPWNTNLSEVDPSLIGLERSVVTIVLVGAYFVGQRRGAVLALAVAGLDALGIAQGFMLVLKGTAILPSDLMALGTAAAVGGSFTYEATPQIAQGIVALLASLVACMLMRPSGKSPVRPWLRAAVTAVVAICCVWSGVNAYNTCDIRETYGTSIDYWWPVNSYYAQGFVPTFLTMAQDMKISVPEGYTDEEAAATEASLAQAYDASCDPAATEARQAQFASEKPSVVVVMNETFSDLSSIYGDLGVGYEGPGYFKSIDDALVRGNLAVSAYGGGTCNSEFEAMTGNSLAYIGMGLYPYTLYDLEGPANLARQFSELGYATTAMHPNLPTNWNREQVYEEMGFDQFLSIDDFAGAPTFHSGVTDQATYEKVLEQLASGSDPKFILDVTMQNHSGYDQGNIDPDQLRDYETGYLGQAVDAQLNEYLACIDASDRDLAWFIEQLRALDRPVVLVFFGDHQPNIGMSINDALYTGEDDATHAARAYQTNYMVWANYDVAATDGMRLEQASTSTLGAIMADAVGAPLTTYQKAALGARLEMPAINLFAYQDNQGFWHNSLADEGPETPMPSEAIYAYERANDAFKKLSHVQYLEFATKVQ